MKVIYDFQYRLVEAVLMPHKQCSKKLSYKDNSTNSDICQTGNLFVCSSMGFF